MLRAFFQPALDIAVLIAPDEDDFAGFFLPAVYPNGQLAVSATRQLPAQPLLVPLSLLYMESAFFLFPAMLCRRIRLTVAGPFFFPCHIAFRLLSVFADPHLFLQCTMFFLKSQVKCEFSQKYCVQNGCRAPVLKPITDKIMQAPPHLCRPL